MRRFALSLALALVLLAAAGLVAGTGVASAHSDSNPAFGDTIDDAPHDRPVGRALGVGACSQPDAVECHPGLVNGFDFLVGDGPNLLAPAVIGLTHNPNCPLHYNDHD
jgi:hypothetical protein